ncbi:class I SAM-dependent methyltransferase [Sphingomonas cavernae]|uniref:Class I SAM-dependent methyltransferase n=1 Tax=Sphingomonas cavernae TaxID=2320861 RepID=A0A418WPY2_9SPHN|nr:class I SAM-dependent methyltransferase [Sphingomonas cavernae]RJF93295.1 class I SAM-dependent methyltransferase [Sphingomonas cavernae]
MTSREATSLLPRSHGAQDTRVTSISDWAHILAFGAIGWPWLLRSLSGGTRADKRALLDRLKLPRDALPNLGSWKADTTLLHLIVDHVEALRPETVVELGAGATTLVTARALELHGGGRLTSFDQHADFVAATRNWLAEHGLEADMRSAALVPAPDDWPSYWYDVTALPEQIWMLVIDGPPWTIHPYVRGAAECLFDRIPVGGVVLLDDGARPGERVVGARWKKRWPNFSFRVSKKGTKGTLIGQRRR